MFHRGSVDHQLSDIRHNSYDRNKIQCIFAQRIILGVNHHDLYLILCGSASNDGVIKILQFYR